jgi:hypothetical protein
MFGKRLPHHLVPINPDNIANSDWVILLEAGTIVGPAQERIRVARCTQEKKIVKKYDVLLRRKYFIVVEESPHSRTVFLSAIVRLRF